MRKSMIVVASALLLAVGAAGTQRLRYDSTVFAASGLAQSGARATEYLPCVRGVREDRCIQLNERGVRRSYRQWLASNGRRSNAALPMRTVRAYRQCRDRADDQCVETIRGRRVLRTLRPIRVAASATTLPSRPARVRAASSGVAVTARPGGAPRTVAPRRTPAQVDTPGI